jgi:mono/diheme cytochrome c family protein
MRLRPAHRTAGPLAAARPGLAARPPAFPLLALWLLVTPLPAGAEPEELVARGAKIYTTLCVGCHGPQGEGVADKYDETLYGTRSVESLARLIHRTMPEQAPGECVDEDAHAVAAYIHGAFYSPEARARLRPPRVELARLTNRQYRESVADLAGSFARRQPATTSGGLRAEYFQSKGMNKKDKRVFDRVDAAVDFDFGTGAPGEGIEPDQFSVAWQGSLRAPDTGEYELRLSTPNGARLYVNTDLRAGDANLRDDSDARRHSASLDLWVSSGGELRTATTRVFLLGGRSYPLRVDFFKYKEPRASVRLEWRPPHGVWSVPGAEHLSPDTSPAVVVIATPLPPDDGSLGYPRGSSVSKDWHDATTRAALEAADQVVARLPSLSGVPENAPDRAERLEQFAATFAGRAFRRPLTDELRERYVRAPFRSAPDLETAIKRVVLLVLKSPRFLYPELGEPLDDWTVASRLALGFWDSLPDAALEAAASRGALRTPPQVREQAERLAADPRARQKLRAFFHDWLALEETDHLDRDPVTYPGFDEALVADLRASVDRFLDQVVWSEASDYRQLLLADYVFLNQRLARFFGTEPPPDDTFQPVTFEPEHRAGILTHPYLLAAHSYHRSSSPIHRGVFLTRNILGRFLKPPPMAIEFMDDRFDPSLTMREKVAELTRSDTCMACHTTINPLGFSLEHFDAAGRFRTIDNGKPVDASADYTTADGEVVPLRSPRDLAHHAANSPDAHRGLVRQMFQHVVKQAPAAYGSDTLTRLEDSFTRSAFHLRRLFVDINTLAALHGLEAPTQAHQ